jgi:membrane protein
VKPALHRLVRTFLEAFRTYSRTASSQRAAAISYSALFSLVPFVVLLVSLVELVLPETLQQRFVSWLVGTIQLPGDLDTSVDTAVAAASTSASLAGLIALVGLLWGASSMARSIRSAFVAVWDVEADQSYVRGKLADLALVLGAGLLVVCLFGISLVAQLAATVGERAREELGAGGGGSAIASVGQIAGSLALGVVVFAALYRFVAPVPIRVRDVLPGALVAAVGFQAANAGFSVYLDRFAHFNDVYGPLGAVFAFLLLVYVMAMVMLYGAAIAATWPRERSRASLGSPEP